MELIRSGFLITWLRIVDRFYEHTRIVNANDSDFEHATINKVKNMIMWSLCKGQR